MGRKSSRAYSAGNRELSGTWARRARASAVQPSSDLPCHFPGEVAGEDVVDSLFMVVITIFSVGYEETIRVDTVAMKLYTVMVIFFGCSSVLYIVGGFIQMIMIAMMISGALAGLIAVNEVMGASGRLINNYVNGAGFVGIAVALMGRNHPVGIVLAALLFGALYQGGTELQFEMPEISREMVVAIQGLVIMFAGAMV